MEPGLAVVGWLLAALAAAFALSGYRTRASTRESIARVCHELRGPLGAARLGLHPGIRGELSAERIQAIDLELERAGLALEDLNALHQVSRHPGARGSRLSERFNLAEMLYASVEAWRPAAAARQASLELSLPAEPVLVFGDRLRLAQGVENLIANAIEHGGGRIEVGCRADGATVRVEVTDDGVGLPAAVAELVRRPRRGHGSRGRGLAIAASITAQHRGRLAAAPSQRGARLVLELPRPDAVDAAAPAPGQGLPRA